MLLCSDQADEDEDGDQSESSTYTGPAPLDLERIARAYEEQCEADRLAENNPDIENQSSSTLRRPVDYDSIGQCTSSYVRYYSSNFI